MLCWALMVDLVCDLRIDVDFEKIAVPKRQLNTEGHCSLQLVLDLATGRIRSTNSDFDRGSRS